MAKGERAEDHCGRILQLSPRRRNCYFCPHSLTTAGTWLHLPAKHSGTYRPGVHLAEGNSFCEHVKALATFCFLSHSPYTSVFWPRRTHSDPPSVLSPDPNSPGIRGQTQHLQMCGPLSSPSLRLYIRDGIILIKLVFRKGKTGSVEQVHTHPQILRVGIHCPCPGHAPTLSCPLSAVPVAPPKVRVVSMLSLNIAQVLLSASCSGEFCEPKLILSTTRLNEWKLGLQLLCQ